MRDDITDTAAGSPRRLFVYNGGLLGRGRARRILELAGWQVTTGKPSQGDAIGVWGASPTAPRGEMVAALTDAPVVRIEDAFLRSLHPGREGEPPLGLLVDRQGVHFDSSRPSELETLLASHPFDDTALMDRARAGMAAMARAHLSKYAAVDPDLAPPEPGFVLVIDQSRGDASIEKGGAISTTFREMLVAAQIEHPDAEIVIKAHPETVAGHREGHFTEKDETDRIRILREPVSPWRLFEHARSVFTVSSGLGFEAILGGHQPRVFGQPFYSGWGLTRDENPVARRERTLTRAQLFAAAMILAPLWYDPCRDRLCSFEEALAMLAAQARAWRDDRRGWVATGVSPWKRRRFRQMFGRVRFAEGPEALDRAAGDGRPMMAWASRMGEDLAMAAAMKGVPLARVEDGFLRSRGLGAALVPAMSLALDDMGVHYDPLHESRLEALIQDSPDLDPGALLRAERLIGQIVNRGLSKYTQGAAVDTSGWPAGSRVLVVGQVEDDAAVIRGCTGEHRTNRDLIRAARAALPDACLVWKPHPDTLRGLRRGALGPEDLALADVVLADADPARVLGEVEAVWTLTSLLGFEALLRGLPVTCLGMPFYAGWGLTRDLTTAPGRRTARPTLAQMVHAALIDYPRYLDPVSGLPCPPEVVIDRLTEGGETPVLPRRLVGALARLKRAVTGT